MKFITTISRTSIFYTTSLLLISLSSFAFKIEQKNLFIPHVLGKLAVVQTRSGFVIEKNGTTTAIDPYRLDASLRKMQPTQLAKFLRSGYISVHKSKDGSYGLNAHHRIQGGGPLGAALGAILGKDLHP